MSTAKKTPEIIRAYGDRANDGVVQMTFTLPLEPGPRAKEAARRFAELHGLRDPLVPAMERCGPGYTYFVVYGRSQHTLDLSEIEVPVVEIPELDKHDIEEKIAHEVKRKLVVVGACTGYDAHTVGIDAIINMKGYAGDKGLESYKGFDAYNLGAQVENEALLARATALGADAILVSQIITARDSHKENAAALITLMKERGVRDRFILLLGGPRIDHKLALELGFDAGFGPGTLPKQVASFVLHKVLARSAHG